MAHGSAFGWGLNPAAELALERLSQETGRREATLDQAVRDVFQAWREPIYRYLLAAAGSPGDAEDLTQETFIRLFQELRKGTTIRKPRQWLFRVAHNLAIDLSRRPDRHRYSDLSFPAPCPESQEPDAEQIILQRERREQLLTKLSPQERRCMELRTEGLGYREIGEVLGIRVPTVQTILGRAVRKLSSEAHG